MGDIAHNLVDPRPHADESMNDMNDVERAPRLVVVAGVVLAFVVCIANFALGQVGIGIAAAIGGLLAFSAGLAWLAMERRRVRDTERELLSNHPAR
jgi:membrane associated rhomboid family serine protease